MFDRHSPAEEAGNIVLVVFKVMFWLIIMAIPPLFNLIMAGIRALLGSMLQQDPTMSRAKAILVTAGIWTGVALIPALLVLGSGGTLIAAVFVLAGGAIIGLVTGGILTRFWVPAEVLESPMEATEAMGINPEVLTPEYDEQDAYVWRVDAEQGVILGFEE